jgi:hypothetical protein
MFRFMREETVRGCRRLHNEERRALYSSSNLSGTMKSRRLRWAGYTADVGIMHTELG